LTELVDFDLPTHREDAKGLSMPVHHLFHAFDHVGDAILLGAAGWSGDAQRLVPAAGPGAKGVYPRQGAEVVDM
jgi:hypothetical protein